ncbi:hypothetical protein CHS0354_022959 [Potamilus streckersoni]|uniref:Phytanoyl-CoA hydroxylase-interacting protein-like C-terminal domain-containing protein n=1 Tax=Potamilus streckersoni TaxID=2493646 RepID=A0AAE0S5S6_9BIVA|nr:hypothetical protein CHS0354_022959 [Potamilus streckersoni]
MERVYIYRTEQNKTRLHEKSYSGHTYKCVKTTCAHSVTEVMIQIAFQEGPNINIIWDRKEVNPTQLYMFMHHKKSLRKSSHWILDLKQDSLSLTFPFHGITGGYDLLVCGLKPLSAETTGLPYYQVYGSASEKDTSSRNTMTIHLKRSPPEQYFQSEQNGDFDVEKDHMPPSHYTLFGLPVRDSIHVIRVHQELPPAYFLYVHKGSNGSRFKFPNIFIPASDYHVTVYESEAQKGGSSDRGISCYSTAKVSNVLHFRAYMTKNEVNELFVKSCNFVQKQQDSRFVKIAHFYRDKLPAYFDFIFEKNCGIMPTYYKTISGDKASTIHLNIKGIFFNTLVKGKKNKKPKISCHGTKRLHIPAPFFFEGVNIYFADFYCHYTAHKVTLIFAVKGTKDDKFCSARLKMVGLFKNPFLYINPEGNVFVRSGVRVEVFYADEIDVQSLMHELGGNNVFLTDVRPLYRPRDIVISKPKRDDCKICNLKARSKVI